MPADIKKIMKDIMIRMTGMVLVKACTAKKRFAAKSIINAWTTNIIRPVKNNANTNNVGFVGVIKFLN